MGTIPAELIATARTTFDLTEASAQQHLYQLTEALLELPDLTLADLQTQSGPDAPLELRLAAKLVASRWAIQRINRSVQLGVVFAMWGEQNRLHPKSANNPNGEDALRVKLEQLHWISQDTPVQWTLYAVDNGCPHGSGRIVQEIMADHPQVKVFFLDDVIPTDEPALAKLASVNDSGKGGAIILGCQQALADGMEVVIYTDADNSVHLGQIGLLLEPFVAGYKVVLGNRKCSESVLVKEEARWGIGIKVLRHMQRMIGQAIFSQGIRDTQAAFKLYSRDILQNILQNPTVYDFSFDTDWLLAVIVMQEPMKLVPFAFIDSAAESTSIVQGPMNTWESLLLGLLEAVRARQIPHNEAMAQVLDEEIQSYKDLELLINHLPPELESATEADLGDPAVMSPQALQVWIKKQRIVNSEPLSH
ncbi:glycosyltransferase family 2 protein [Anaerolineales bacterium HSG24]|nr:glycosyltransferase family 2 protein [Anaerolineales bacterium HSG24]